MQKHIHALCKYKKSKLNTIHQLHEKRTPPTFSSMQLTTMEGYFLDNHLKNAGTPILLWPHYFSLFNAHVFLSGPETRLSPEWRWDALAGSLMDWQYAKAHIQACEVTDPFHYTWCCQSLTTTEEIRILQEICNCMVSLSLFLCPPTCPLPWQETI